jgi:hypothetical protein
MEIFKYIIALYIFFALIIGAFAFAAALAFPNVANYAYSVALVVHAVVILTLFILEINNPPQKQIKSEAA